MWLCGLRTQHSVDEDVGSILGLTQQVKEPALLQAGAQVEDVAQVQCCCGCGMGLSCSSHLTPSPGTSLCYRYGHKKKKKKKKVRRTDNKWVLVMKRNQFLMIRRVEVIKP